MVFSGIVEENCRRWLVLKFFLMGFDESDTFFF